MCRHARFALHGPDTVGRLQKYDFSSNVSAPVKKIQYDVGQQVLSAYACAMNCLVLTWRMMV